MFSHVFYGSTFCLLQPYSSATIDFPGPTIPEKLFLNEPIPNLEPISPSTAVIKNENTKPATSTPSYSPANSSYSPSPSIPKSSQTISSYKSECSPSPSTDYPFRSSFTPQFIRPCRFPKSCRDDHRCVYSHHTNAKELQQQFIEKCQQFENQKRRWWEEECREQTRELRQHEQLYDSGTAWKSFSFFLPCNVNEPIFDLESIEVCDRWQSVMSVDNSRTDWYGKILGQGGKSVKVLRKWIVQSAFQLAHCSQIFICHLSRYISCFFFCCSQSNH